MFILQEKVKGKFENVSGKFQYGAVSHAERRAEKDYGGKLKWDITGLSRTFAYGMDDKGKIFYQIIIRSNNPMKMTGTKKSFEKWITNKGGNPDSSFVWKDGPARYEVQAPDLNLYWYGHAENATQARILAVNSYEYEREENPKLRQKGNTKVIKGSGKELTVRLYKTDIVKILADGSIQLNSGGHKTPTTKRRMNEAADELQLYFNVFSKGGKWYVSTEDRLEPPQTIEYSDGMIISGPQHLRNPKRKSSMARKKKRSAKQLANDKRLGRMAKARAKKKRGGRRKKVARKKVARKVTRRKTRRNPQKARPGLMVSKRSHLFLIFACKGNKIKFQGVITWTTKKANAIYFKAKSEASKEAHYRAKQNLPTVRGWQIGVAPDNMSSAQIKAQCAGK